jgi:hypothetical protein
MMAYGMSTSGRSSSADCLSVTCESRMHWETEAAQCVTHVPGLFCYLSPRPLIRPQCSADEHGVHPTRQNILYASAELSRSIVGQDCTIFSQSIMRRQEVAMKVAADFSYSS